MEVTNPVSTEQEEVDWMLPNTLFEKFRNCDGIKMVLISQEAGLLEEKKKLKPLSLSLACKNWI